MHHKLTYEQSLRLGNRLVGTADAIEQALESIDLHCDDYDVSEVEEVLSKQHNIERCHSCDWWYDCCELVDDNGEVVGCDQCRDK